MEFQNNYQVEDYILGEQFKNVPPEIQQRACMCSIDLMGALILGAFGKQCEAGRKLAKYCGMFGAITPVGSSESFNLLGSTIVMGHASNSFDIDDGYNMIKGHPGSSFISGLMSAALYKNKSYTDYLSALIVGYEVTIRWALAMQDHYQFLHSTGTYGAFGTAAVAGRILGFNRAQLNNALSIADYHAPLTPVMRAVEFPSMNKDGVPFGAMVGMVAVLETMCGETGKTHLLEIPKYHDYLDSLGSKFYMKDLYFKPYTCCRWAHQPILACQDLMKTYGFSSSDVSSVTVYTFQSAALLSKNEPKDTDEAQYNIAFPVASVLVHGDVGFEQICDSAVNDKKVLAMMKKLRFEVDDALDKCFPEKRLARVEIKLQNGIVLKSKIYSAAGEHDDPNLSMDWIKNKFRRITAPFLSSEDGEEILNLLSHNSTVSVRSIVEKVNMALFT